MKKYIVIAAPCLIVLFALLAWLLKSPAPTPVETKPIQVKVEPASPIAPTPAPIVVVEEPQQRLPVSAIADASDNTPKVLTNEEVIDKAPPVKTDDNSVLSYVSDNLHSSMTEWLSNKHVLSKVVRAINALEEGKVVSKYRPINMPSTSFIGHKTGEKWQMSSKNYERYTPYISVLEAAGETGLLKAYRHFHPGLKQAYASLGVNKGSFNKVTRGAIQQLLKAPELATPPYLTHNSVMYKYLDPKLEALPPAQKLMLRMGPKNSQRLKILLKKLLAEIE